MRTIIGIQISFVLSNADNACEIEYVNFNRPLRNVAGLARQPRRYMGCLKFALVNKNVNPHMVQGLLQYGNFSSFQVFYNDEQEFMNKKEVQPLFIKATQQRV